MKYLKYLLPFLLLPSLAFATISATFNATSTDNGGIQPTAINGNIPYINVPGIFSLGSSTFMGAFRFPSLSNGLLKTTTGLVGTAVNGTDYTLITAQDCTGIGHLLKVTAAGVFTCSSDTGGGGAGTGTVSTTTPLVSGQVDFSTGVSTIGNDSTFLFDTASKRLSFTYSSSTYSSSGVASTTFLTINGQSFNNLLGTGLSNVGGALTNSGVISLGNGTGTTCSGTNPGTCNVNTTQNITNLSNLSTAGTVNTTASGGLYSTATSTPGTTGPIGYSGTLGQFIGGISGNFTCTTASSGVGGCLSNTSFDTFNNKQNTIGVTWPITLSGATVGFNGISTTTPISIGQVLYGTGVNTVGTVATSSIASGVGITVANGSTAYVIGAQPSVACNTASLTVFGCLTTGDFSRFNSATTTAGTGLTYTANSFNVNTTQNITKLSNLTGNGFTLTSGSDGTLGTQTFPCTFAQGCTGATTFSPNSIIVSNAAGTALQATGTQLTVGNLIATTSASSFFLGNLGVGTSTPGSILAIGAQGTGINFFDNGTSTFSGKGIDLRNGGCFSVQGVCVGSISGGAGTITAVGDVSSGAAFSGTQGTTLTFKGAIANATILYDGVMMEISNTTAIGTTTGQGNELVVSSTTASQIGLYAGTGIAGYSFRNAGGNFYLGTTTVQGTATTTVPNLTILANGGVGLNDSTPDFAFESVGSNTGGYFGITKTTDGDIFNILSNGTVNVGTTTNSSNALLSVVNGSGSQLSLGDGVPGNNQVNFRSAGGNLYIATTTTQGTATTTPAAVTIFTSGVPAMRVGTSTCMGTLKNGSLCLGGANTTTAVGQTGSTTIYASKLQFDFIDTGGGRRCMFVTSSGVQLIVNTPCNP